MIKFYSHKYIFSLIILMIIGSTVNAQTAKLLGVINHIDNRPAINVTVVVAGRVSFTDISGQYRIDNLPFGFHTIQIKIGGQLVKQENIEVNSPTLTKNIQIPF